MSFTNNVAIIEQVITDITSAVSSYNITNINNDEPINLIYSDLPSIAVYPVKEDFIYDESSSNNDSKKLYLRIELRMKNGPASIVCSPVINSISDAIKADRTLNQLAIYVERQSIQWANEQISQGQVCGASVDLEITYFI